jgi:GNAT superfamily N-acetyltransferase
VRISNFGRARAGAEICGRICYNAFKTIPETHGFAPDFPAPEVAIGLLTWMFAHPKFHSVIAEIDGRIVGSNFLDERNAIAGVGPITVDPTVQNRAIGRRLMDAVHQRAAEKKFTGVRLIQAGFHTRSLSLYAKLGYDVREHLACMQGNGLEVSIQGARREVGGRSGSGGLQPTMPTGARPRSRRRITRCDRARLRKRGGARWANYRLRNEARQTKI